MSCDNNLCICYPCPCSLSRGLDAACKSPALLPTTSTGAITVALPQSNAYPCPRPPRTEPIPCVPSMVDDLDGEAQTMHKLYLRKRVSSPYQIKLPFMKDRLRVRNGRRIVHSLGLPSDHAQEAEEAPPLISRLPDTLDPPSVLHTAVSPTESSVAHLFPISVISNSRQSLTASPQTLRDDVMYPSLPAVDTWAEICEDLCRAMEVLAILSELDKGAASQPPDSHPISLSDSCSVMFIPNLIYETPVSLGSRALINVVQV